jgi:nucleoside-diphosphate-sugar epimerase
MNVLVTGHLGFVGRNFTSYFTSRGHTVKGIDIKEGNDCRDFFRKSSEKFDLTVHLAAIVGGRETIEKEPLSVATDLSIDAEFFNWAVRTSQERVVYYSSSAAYPIRHQSSGKRVKMSEDLIDLNQVENPDLTYGWAKLTGEFLAQFAERQGVRVHVFRPFSGFGSDQDLSYPFPSFLDRTHRKVDDFQIWGNGEQVRDFIHIDDVIEGTMKAVELDYKGPLNLGWGRPTSFNDLAETMFTISGYRPTTVTRLIDKPAGVAFRCCDPTEFFKVYKPKFSLEESISRCLAEYGAKL